MIKKYSKLDLQNAYLKFNLEIRKKKLYMHRLRLNYNFAFMLHETCINPALNPPFYFSENCFPKHFMDQGEMFHRF